MARKGTVLVIEGLIGAGKSTLGLSIEKKNPKAKYFPEPFDEDFLRLYLGDMKKYGLAFQLFILSKRGELYRQARQFADQGGLAIIDRSMMGDAAFAYGMFCNGIFNRDDWQIYLTLWNKELARIEEPDMTLFLEVSEDKLLNRIIQRNRSSEPSKYTKKFLIQLKNNYDYVFRELDPRSIGKLVRLNWNQFDQQLIPDFDH